jgi:hypothetical protein
VRSTAGRDWLAQPPPTRFSKKGFLLRLTRHGAYEIQIAPTVVYETLRLNDARLRRAILVRLMTNPRFDRFMPEAYSESMEILREVQRIRPDWLRDRPDIPFFRTARGKTYSRWRSRSRGTFPYLGRVTNRDHLKIPGAPSKTTSVGARCSLHSHTANCAVEAVEMVAGATA